VAIILISSTLFNHQRHKKISCYTLSLGLFYPGLRAILSIAYFLVMLLISGFSCLAVFNVADSAITVGAVLLAWSILKKPKNMSCV